MNYQESFQESILNPEKFWAEQASRIAWFKQPSTNLTTNERNYYDWYKGGTTNLSYLALDYHIEQGRGEELALIYDSAATGKVQKFTFIELHDQVARFAGVLRSKGVTKGDRVIIYMPMIPQAAIAMLACVRIGAIHSVVFGGFAPHELAIRIDDAKPKVLVTSSYGIEFDKIIPYKPLVDEAIGLAQHQIANCIVVQREGLAAELILGRDEDYEELMKNARPATYVELDATEHSYIIYTSGTTGKPKGIVRDTGGYAVALRYSLDQIYNIKPGQVFWAASDVGWVVGHSYIVYGPLIHGCTTVLFEGKPVRTPDAGTFWRVASAHRVNVMFAAPTSFRAIRKEDPNGNFFRKYDLSELQSLFVAGERCDPSTFYWLSDLLQKPVIDHWWQTESGWPMIANMLGLQSFPLKAGSATKPVCGYDIQILSEEGKQMDAHKEGYVAIKLPLPPGCLQTIWQNEERFHQSYLKNFKGYYLTGDGGYVDDEGYVYIMGRIDDVINVAGHRLSTGEMEELLAGHPAVAECAVLGIADELRGQRPIGLVVLKDGVQAEENHLEAELIALIRQQIGAVAYFRNALVVKRLPKTRSGKILRKVLRQIADGESYAVPSTIDDPAILDEITEKLKNAGIGQAFIL